MIAELDRLEKLMPLYSEPLMLLSKSIRRSIWSISNEENLAKVLHEFNLCFEAMVRVCGEQIEILDEYVNWLDQYSIAYTERSISEIYNTVRKYIEIIKIQEKIKEHWRQINPYFRSEYAREDLFNKGLIELLDDFFKNIIDVCPEEFFYQLDNYNFGNLIRGRRKVWHCKNDLVAPPIEVAKECNIINRWNPPEKRYLYLVVGKGIPEDTETVCEEMRTDSEEIVTLANFEVKEPEIKAMILDLDYERILRKDIERYMEQQIEHNASKLRRLLNVIIGKMFLKEMCEVIFVPLDKIQDTDNIERDKCYKAFHILAEYLENRGFAGICYPSTRMKLIGKQGTNMVLFDAESAEPILDTFRIVET
jgi:hypothetical protein